MVNYAIFNGNISEHIFCRLWECSRIKSSIQTMRCAIISCRKTKTTRRKHTEISMGKLRRRTTQKTKSVSATFGSATLWHYRLCECVNKIYVFFQRLFTPSIFLDPFQFALYYFSTLFHLSDSVSCCDFFFAAAVVRMSEPFPFSSHRLSMIWRYLLLFDERPIHFTRSLNL